MTFTEAAIEVLRREGKPLHFRKLAEIAIRESLLDHVGKIPEETMADQLIAHCRLPHADRRVIPVQQGTFALTEWGLDEDPVGLDGLVEPPPEGEPPYRGRERHPVPSRDMARSTGRAEPGRGRRREEEERRGRKFPPPAEVAYEILAGAGRALGLAEIAAQGAERLLMPDAFVRETASLQAALAEDNRRRESAGRKPLFQIDGETVTLVAQPEPGERRAVPPQPARPAASAAELRRVALAALRRRLKECDGPTLEHVAARLLEKLGFRDLKVAKRGREHVIYTARRRMGLADLRHGIRIMRTGADASRRDVSELRRDLGHYGAQIGVVLTAGDAARDARGDASAPGQLPVVLLCGEALAETLAEAGIGTVPVVIPEVDEAFFRSAAEAAEKEDAARRARREERERGERPERGERSERGERAERERPERGERREEPATTMGGPAITEVLAESVADAEPLGDEGAPALAPDVPMSAEGSAEPLGDEDEDEGGEEDLEADEAETAGAGEGAGEASAETTAAEGTGAEGPERRRRRRRRRRRGGRGRSREGAAAAAQGAQPTEGAPPAAAAGPSASSAAGAKAAPSAPEPSPSPPREPTGGGEGGAAA